MSLPNIVDDILIQILCMLPLGDVLSVRQTSKRLEAVTHLRTVWHDKFCFEVLSKGLPIPGTPIPLPEIPVLDLEWRTRLASRVQKMWVCPAGPLRPVLRRSIPAARQAALRIGGRELLTLHNDRVIIWHLDGTSEPTTEKIRQEHALGSDSAWKIYKDHGDANTIAISNSSGEEVFILGSAFDELPLQKRYPGSVLGLFDQFILTFASPGPGSNIDVYNWMDTSFGVATIQSHPSFFGNLITFTKFDSHLIVIWEACLTIYPIPSLPVAGQYTTLHPIQVFFFQFPIQSPAICSPCTPSNFPNSGFALTPNSKHIKTLSICYQIAGTGGMRGSILSRNVSSEDADPPPFRLARNPLIVGEDCVCMRVGHSGRGLWLDSRSNIYRCSAISTVTVEGDEYPTLDMGRRSSVPLCTLPGILKDCHGDWALDFDEGMGRIAYCDEAGLVSIVDVV